MDPTKPLLTDGVSETKDVRRSLREHVHLGYFSVVHDYFKGVIRRDLAVLDRSDFAIFRIEPETPSYGTIHELVVSCQQRKPVLIITKKKKDFPLWLIGLLDMDYVFENQNDLIDYLIRVNAGKIKLDTKYWKLLDFSLR